jgi:uncharacterized membrane protein YqaE (UPF0057 family)
MKKSLTLTLFLAVLMIPVLVSGSHPAHPSAVQRSWTVTFRDRFHSMDAAAKKSLKQSIHSELRQFKKAKRAGEDPDVGKLLLTLIALILPPLAVYLHQGEINSKFWISLLLTLLIWVPGVVYALLVIFGVIP